MTPGVLPTTSFGRSAASSSGGSPFGPAAVGGSGSDTSAGAGSVAGPDVDSDVDAGPGTGDDAEPAGSDVAGRERVLAGRPPRARAASARSSFEVVTGSSAGSVPRITARSARPASSPLFSSTSSSMKRSIIRPPATTSTSSTLSSASSASPVKVRARRSWRIVTISMSGASPACSRTSERAADGGHAWGSSERSAGPSSSSRRWSADAAALDALTERIVMRGPRRSRTAYPARASSPFAVSR